MIGCDQFREDLFFRLNTFEIHVPPLRDRKDDLPLLARHLLDRYNARRGGPEPSLSPEAVESLAQPRLAGQRPRTGQRHGTRCHPGGEAARFGPSTCRTRFPCGGLLQSQGTPAGPHFSIPTSPGSAAPSLRDIEMKYIQMILEKHNGNKPAASKELGISLKTLYNKINQLQQT